MRAATLTRSVARLAAATLSAAILAVAAQAQGPGSTALTVRGNVEHTLTLSIEDLKQLPVQRIEDVRVVRATDSASMVPDVKRRYTGCLLRDVLERAKPVDKNRLDLRNSIVIITAGDGYRAIFSWSELYLSPIGDGALVVYARRRGSSARRGASRAGVAEGHAPRAAPRQMAAVDRASPAGQIALEPLRNNGVRFTRRGRRHSDRTAARR